MRLDREAGRATHSRQSGFFTANYYLAIFDPLHQSNVARMRFRPLLVLDPDFLRLQQFHGRDVALIVAAVMVVPTQAEYLVGSLCSDKWRSRR
jgi:hypothetical protein